MEITLSTVNDALTSAGGRAIDEMGLTLLREAADPHLIGQWVANARRGGEAAAPLLRAGVQAGLVSRLRNLGFEQASLAQARSILRSEGLEGVRAAVAAASRADRNALSILGQWLCRAATEGAGTEGNLPVMPADTNHGAQNVARSQMRPAMAPPTHHPTGQVTRVSQQQPDRNRAALEHAQERWADARVVDSGQRSDSHSQPATDVTARTYDQAKAHGGRAALTIAADTTTRDAPTVAIEAAAILDSQKRTYDWSNKIRFQLTVAELQLVTGLLLGYIPELRLSNHGVQNDKWLMAVRQDEDARYGGTIKFTLGQGKAQDKAPLTVQVDATSLGSILSLFLRQCGAYLKSDTPTTSAIVRQVSNAYMLQQACRQGSGGHQHRRAG